MAVLIVSSTQDPASTNIKKGLLKNSLWEETDTFFDNIVYKNSNYKDVILVTINDKTILHEGIEKEVKDGLGITPKQIIYVSRHRSKSGKPTLTTHPIGNYGEAMFGGETKTLTMSSPRLMTHLLNLLKKNATEAKLYHHVCFEVTHHGPYLMTPTLFVEVGSIEEEWVKEWPAEIVANSVLELLKTYSYEEDMPKNIPILIGIGGGHYAPRFTEMVFEKNVAFGHMIPSYHIKDGNIDIEMIQKAIDATPNVSGAYIHKKSLKKSQVRAYKEICEELDLPVFSSKEFKDL